MKKYINFLLLRTFGIKPASTGEFLRPKPCKTVVNYAEKLNYNQWIYSIYKQLNPNL